MITQRKKTHLVLSAGKPRLALIGQKNAISKAPCIWKKVVPGKTITLLPELSWPSQLLQHFLTKLHEPFTWETKS